MFSLSPRVTFYASPRGESFRERCSRSSKPDFPNAGRESAVIARLVRHHPETSYWQGDANEMAAINTILIIVNNAAP
jgi:hypothetical protein